MTFAEVLPQLLQVNDLQYCSCVYKYALYLLQCLFRKIFMFTVLTTNALKLTTTIQTIFLQFQFQCQLLYYLIWNIFHNFGSNYVIPQFCPLHRKNAQSTYIQRYLVVKQRTYFKLDSFKTNLVLSDLTRSCLEILFGKRKEGMLLCLRSEWRDIKVISAELVRKRSQVTGLFFKTK